MNSSANNPVIILVPKGQVTSYFGASNSSGYDGSTQTSNFKISYSWRNQCGKNMNQFFTARKQAHQYVVKTVLESLENFSASPPTNHFNLAKSLEETIFNIHSLSYKNFWKPLHNLQLELHAPEIISVRVLSVNVFYSLHKLNLSVVLLFKKPGFYGTTELKMFISTEPEINLYEFSRHAVARSLKYHNDVEKLPLPLTLQDSVSEEWRSRAGWNCGGTG